MSDYLSDLAARSLASTEVILPRLASRFEPSPAEGLLNRAAASRIDGPAAGMEDLAEVPTETAMPASRRRMAWEVDAPRPRSRVESAPGQPRDEAGADAAGSRRSPGLLVSQVGTIIAPTAQAASWLSHSGQPVERAAKPGDAVSIQPALGAAPPASRQDEPASLAKPQVGESVRPPDRPLDMAEVPGLDKRIRSALGDALALELGQLSAQDRPMPSRKDAASQVQPAAPARVITQPQVAIAAPARPAALDGGLAGKLKAQQEPSPAPTIQVTIGRIEVRATPLSAPVKRGLPPVSTMSLEDYLRSRSGDRR